MSLVGVTMQGNRRASLEELRDRLAMEIEQRRDERGLAALSPRFVDVLKQLDGLADYQRAGAADEILARREKRRRARCH